MIKVKQISGDEECIEFDINGFFENNTKIELVDIKYTSSFDTEGDKRLHALIIYKR